MREIKFRAWESSTKRMIEDATYSEECRHDVNPWIYMQYTGLKDKKGKGIYEGDLYRDSTGVSLITWNNIFASFCIRRNGWLYDHFFSEVVVPEDGEVIGNIYENPELLKKMK